MSLSSVITDISDTDLETHRSRHGLYIISYLSGPCQVSVTGAPQNWVRGCRLTSQVLRANTDTAVTIRYLSLVDTGGKNKEEDSLRGSELLQS